MQKMQLFILGSTSVSVSLQSAGIGVGASHGTNELSTKTKIIHKQVFPSPYKLMDFGKVEDEDWDVSLQSHGARSIYHK